MLPTVSASVLWLFRLEIILDYSVRLEPPETTFCSFWMLGTNRPNESSDVSLGLVEEIV